MFAVVFIIVALILANALYVAAEFSTVSARRSRIRQLAQEGNKSAIRLLPIVEDSRRLDRYVAACQIGITLSSLVLGAYGQATLPPVIEPLFSTLGGLQDEAALAASSIAILIGLTSLQVIFAELLPKSISLQYPTQTALLTSLPMAASLRIFSWFIVILNGSGIIVLRLFGADQSGHRHIHSPDEIELLLVESRDGGMLEQDEQEKLQRALVLGNKPVQNLMVHRTRVEEIDVDAPVDSVVAQVIDSPYTRFPVYRESQDNVIGTLHAKDLAQAYLAEGAAVDLEALLWPSLAIPASVHADQALTLMRDSHAPQGVVIDEFGAILGLVTLEDLLADVLFDSDSSIAAIADKLPDGRIRLPASLTLDDAALWIGSEIDSEAATLGGLVTERLGHIPGPGEKVTVDGSTIEVESASATAVTSVLVTPAVREES